MDSVTQFTLGAGLGTVLLGHKIGYRKAALTGGLLGTMPDLDVVWPFDNPVDEFVLHRGPTHSLIMQALAAPIVALGLTRLFKNLRPAFMKTTLIVYIIFATHALLDAMTVYGTQLLWPLSREAFGLGSIFIIDPLYTLPLLIITLWALAWPGRGEILRKSGQWVLVISTLYLGWTATAQALMEQRAKTLFKETGVETQHLIAIPTPFNSGFWRIIATNQDDVWTAYGSIVTGEDQWHIHQNSRGLDGIACELAANIEYQRLATFTDGLYQIEKTAENDLIFQDLRMGLPPDFVFSFHIASLGPDGLVAIAPNRVRSDRTEPGDWDWLIAGILGDPIVRPAEAATLVMDRDAMIAAAKRISSVDDC